MQKISMYPYFAAVVRRLIKNFGGNKKYKEMAEMTTISVRMAKDMKEDFEEICKAMGLKVSDAINIFVRKVIEEEAIPFPVKLEKN